MLELLSMSAPSIFLNDFTVLDFAFAHREWGVTGASYYVSAELEGELDEKDFLLDFGPAKKLLKALVDDSLDHKFLLPEALGSPWSYESPAGAVARFPGAEEITPALLEAELARLALARLPANVRSARFRLRSPERLEAEPSYRYTHGLRFHDGNCQRLLHGHRNPVEVWAGGARDRAAESLLAREWDHAHFAPRATIRNLAELDLPLGRRQPDHPGSAELEYTSSQGRFRCRIPASRLVVTEHEPSVETIAALAARRLREEGWKGELRVVAYEGLNKGASFTDTP